MTKVTIYTDGACSGNPGPGGWGAILMYNGIKINKNSELLGNLNLVLFSPDDTVVLKESPASRRKFLDILISQISKKYVISLQEYNKVPA